MKILFSIFSHTYPVRQDAIGLWIALAALVLVAAAPPASADTAENFFDDTSIQDLYLTVDPNDWASLKEHYLENTYYRATLNWNGNEVSLGIRSRGRGSRSPEKPSFDFKFGEFKKGQRFLGLKATVLRSGNQDASMMRERIAMKIFRRIGLPAPREVPAKLFINGEYFGFFTMVEKPDEVFLQRVLGESDGYLYEWNPDMVYNFEYLGDDPSLYSPVLWEPKTHEDDPNPAPVVELVRVVNQVSDAEFPSAVAPYLDLKLLMAYVAVENFLGDPDGLLNDYYGMNNFYFYRFQGSDRSQFLPWDKELSFLHPDRDILQNMDANVLTRRAFAIPEIRNAYLGTQMKLAKLMGGAEGWLAQEIEREYAQIREAARNDPHKQHIVDGGLQPSGPEDFEAEADALRAFARYRAGVVIDAVKAAGYSEPEEPVITAASNAASGDLPILARGSLASVYGRGLAAAAAQPGAYPLPTMLEDTTVLVNGARTSLLYSSPEQINIQIPWDADGREVSVVVNRAGTLSEPEIAHIVEASPGVFFVVHADGVPVTAHQPAHPDEGVLVYATGLGPVDKPVVTGQPPSGDRMPEPLEMPVITVGGQTVPPTAASLVSGMVGVFGIEFTIPPATPVGPSVPLTIASGTQSATITIPIQ